MADERKVTPGSRVGRRTGFEPATVKPKLESTEEQRAAFWARHGGQRFWEAPSESKPRKTPRVEPVREREREAPAPAPRRETPREAPAPRHEPAATHSLATGEMAERIRRLLDQKS